MPTDKERREVAARLRDMAPGSDWPKYVAEACGMDGSKMSNHFHTYTAQLCQRIADLIEPRVCRKVPGKMKYGRRMPACSECGYSLGDKRWNFCPNCGARVVSE